MPNQSPFDSRTSWFNARPLGCLLSLAAGIVAAVVLLAVAGGRLALAAPPLRPLSNIITVTVSIQAAIDAAQAGDTVFIPAGHYTESLTLSKTVSLRGALSSTTIIHALAGQRVLTVTGPAINNSTVISGLTFRDGNATDLVIGGGGIRVELFAQPLLQNLIISGNQATSGGGGLSIDAGSPLRLVNVSFLSNTAIFHGGGVFSLDELIVEGGLYRNNRCTGPSCLGGGLAMGNVNPVDLTDVQFISNTSLSNGGGAYVSGPLTVQGGLFLDNSAGGSGGGLYDLAAVAMIGTHFVSNTSASEGGGAALNGGATVQNGLFQANRCTNVDCSGGGLYVTGATLSVLDTQFISNTAYGYGGGGLLAGAATTFQGGLFQGNASLAPTLSTFTFGGGGLFALNTLAVTGTRFIDNSAAGYGGGLLQEANDGRVVNALFAGNTSSAGGDALAIDSFSNAPVSLAVLHATLVTPAGSPSGSAIHVLTGTLGITNSILANFTTGISRTGGVAAEDYNLFSSVGVTTTGGVSSGGNSLVGNPAFRDPNAGDYHLAFGSAALNAAVNAGVATDADGDLRPIGPGPDIGHDEARLVTITLSKSDGQASASPGSPLTYTIVINNTGPNIAAGVLVTDSLPAGLVPGTWTCLASAGSSCPASGSGSINATVTVANGSFVQFSLYATVAGSASGDITNTVSVVVPAGLVNTNSLNSSASDGTLVAGPPKKIYLPLLLR